MILLLYELSYIVIRLLKFEVEQCLLPSKVKFMENSIQVQFYVIIILLKNFLAGSRSRFTKKPISLLRLVGCVYVCSQVYVICVCAFVFQAG